MVFALIVFVINARIPAGLSELLRPIYRCRYSAADRRDNFVTSPVVLSWEDAARILEVLQRCKCAWSYSQIDRYNGNEKRAKGKRKKHPVEFRWTGSHHPEWVGEFRRRSRKLWIVVCVSASRTIPRGRYRFPKETTVVSRFEQSRHRYANVEFPRITHPNISFMNIKFHDIHDFGEK